MGRKEARFRIRMQNPTGRDVLAGKAIETGPVEPVPLAPAQQGMPPCAAYLAAEAVQSQQVRRDCMIREVSIQDPLKPRTNHLKSANNPSNCYAATFDSAYS
jgi:hypothetical protein